MIEGFLAIAPIAVVIAIGWALKQSGFPGDGFWEPAERLTYFVFLPSLIVGSLASARLDALDIAPMVGVLVAALLVVAAAMLALRTSLGRDGPAFTSLFQGAIRGNTYAGIAAAGAIYGADGVTLAAVAVAAAVPTVNLLSVTVLSRYVSDKPADMRAVVRAMARNPLILACVIGALLSISGIGAPEPIGAALDIFGRAALAVGLLCLGAGLSFSGLGPARGGIAVSCAFKLLGLPLIAVLGSALVGLDGAAAGVVILFTAAPSASSAFILARRMGGDSHLMAQTVAVSTIAAAATLPVLLAVFT